ncbi:MAG: class I SAM-dependent methyltransferase [Planctomycetota bacterium]
MTDLDRNARKIILLYVTPGLLASLREDSSEIRREFESLKSSESSRSIAVIVFGEKAELPELAALEPSHCADVNALKQFLRSEPKKRTSRPKGRTKDPEKFLPRGPADLPQIVKSNFARQAEVYHHHGHDMQEQHVLELLSVLYGDFVISSSRFPRVGSWLDLGCGDGLVGKKLWDKKDLGGLPEQARKRMKLRAASYRVGVDYSESMIAHCPPPTSTVDAYTHLITERVEDLTPDHLLEETDGKLGSVNLVFANDLFHWLIEEDPIKQALERAGTLLNTGGRLVASVAAEGTGRLFREAYEQLMRDELDKTEFNSWRSFIRNPIFLQEVHKFVQWAQEAGFAVNKARSEYQPLEYTGAPDYVDDAKTYGEQVFMAPLYASRNESLPETGASPFEAQWNKLGELMDELVKKKENKSFYSKEDGKYYHDQYMIYLSLEKLP